MYDAVSKPILTYAAPVCWKKVEMKSTQAKLSKLQRLACVGITGAMRTTPTAALEVLLDLLPLHIVIKKEALLFTARLVSGDSVGDKKNNWDNERPKPRKGSHIWYTDGLKTDGHGAGVYGIQPRLLLFTSMGQGNSVFQAEVHAIELCLRQYVESGATKKHIYIHSDSRAALLALKAHEVTSKLMWDCLQLLILIASRHRVYLIWVPGHSGVMGNEAADILPRKGAAQRFIGPEPFTGLPWSSVIRNYYISMQNEAQQYWTNME
ncbi:uncharacterized protein LOC118756832, partial [Rhagoletis pomonella]|uniref:uncharacterized protein LOC118756832 n=1 Tax=Rhagoletis pomonella TaxID=28610 RepID=UPI00177F66F9